MSREQPAFLANRLTLRPVIMGAIWSVASAFPVAGLMSLVVPFPVPIVRGRDGGFTVAMFCVLFVGVFDGGLVFLAALGALSGATTAFLVSPPKQRQMVRAVSVTLTAIWLFAVADGWWPGFGWILFEL